MAITKARGQVAIQIQANVEDGSLIVGTDRWTRTISWLFDFRSAGNGANQFNQLCASVLTVPAGIGQIGSLNLWQTLTNVVKDANASFARVKLLALKLLAVADTDPDTGTACSQVLYGAGSNAWQGWFADTTSRERLNNSEVLIKGGATAMGIVVSAANAGTLNFVNQDNSNAAKIAYAIYGSTG